MGGAGGLVDSAGFREAEGQIVIGTNWTLRAVEPSIWLVVDENVWKSESPKLSGCSPNCIALVNRGIFGGGIYSVARKAHYKRVGGPPRTILELGIRPLKGPKRNRKGQIEYAVEPPFIPRSLREDLHPGGNSLCFAIQVAHLMGADPIYAVGFTLQNGSNYFFSRTNPVTKKPTIYQEQRALDWLRYYEKLFPGRVLLDPGFNGPVYEVFKRATFMRDKPAPDNQLPTVADTNQTRTVQMPVKSQDSDKVQTPESVKKD